MEKTVREKCPVCSLITDQKVINGKKVGYKKCKRCNNAHSWIKKEEEE